FRKVSANKLLIIGSLLIVLNTGWSAVEAFRQVEQQRLAAAADAATQAGKSPTEEQAAAQKELEGQRKRQKPSAEELEKEAKQWRGNPLEVIAARAKLLAVWHGLPYYDPGNLALWSMMFLGMGLFKFGVFSAARSYRFYICTALVGYLVGILLNSY